MGVSFSDVYDRTVASHHLSIAKVHMSCAFLKPGNHACILIPHNFPYHFASHRVEERHDGYVLCLQKLATR